jgi:lipoate-protein ligase A
MALDDALLAGVGAGSSPPTIRVFGWSPPTVSLGHSQRAADELDLAACRRAGVGVVNRPTGGRAVFHAGELTYSVAAPAGTEPLGRTVLDSYCAIGRALVAGLATLGVEAVLDEKGTDPGLRRGGPSPPCFVSSGRFEVVVGGRKLIGSAQRRAGRALLQHGSLLMDRRHADLAGFLAGLSDRERDELRASLESRTASLESVLGRAVAFDDVARAVRRGFEMEWGADLSDGCVTRAEVEGAEALATDYSVWR